MVVRQTLGEQWPSADLERRFRAGDPAVTPQDLGVSKARELRRELSEEDAAREEKRLAALAELTREIADYPSPVPDLVVLTDAARAALDALVARMEDHAVAVRGFKSRMSGLGVKQGEAGAVTSGGRTLRVLNPMAVIERIGVDVGNAHRLGTTNVRVPEDHLAVKVQLRGLDRTR